MIAERAVSKRSGGMLCKSALGFVCRSFCDLKKWVNPEFNLGASFGFELGSMLES